MAKRYLGANLNQVSYFSSGMAFLNLFKSAGNNPVFSPWWTNPGTINTAYLQMDSDGNVTTLVAAASQGTFTSVFPLVNKNICGGILPPNVTSLYPTGNYRFQFSGPGTMVVSGDATVPSQTAPSGVTITGNTITSTLAMGVSASVTLNVAAASANGIQIAITSLPNDGVNYLKYISLVESQYTTIYDAGQLFHPLFLAQLAPYSRLRFMDWGCTNLQDIAINFSPAPPSGATSGTMTATWPYPTGTYTFVFMTAQVIQVNCTFGSAAVTWSTALTSALSATGHSAMAYFVAHPTWATRPVMSNFSWGSNAGVPHEVKIALCNALGVDCWINIPVSANYIDSTYASNLANLIKSGAGASIATPVGSFSGLNAAQKVYVEVGNEVWNLGTFPQAGLAYNMDQVFAGASGNFGQWWYGTQVANAADAFFSVYGASFANTVTVSMGAQTATGNGIAFLNTAMTTTGWSGGNAYTHHIGAIHLAPYMQLLSGISQAGLDFIASQPNPVDIGFSLAYTSTFGGVDYHATYGLKSGGYVRGSTVAALSPMVTTIRGNGTAWANLSIIGYESGEDTAMSGFYSGASVATVFEAMYHDARMQYLYYDPTHQLSSNPGYLVDLGNDGMRDFNLFNDCTSPTANPSLWALDGDEGQIESIFQPLSGVNTPPKYAGVLSWSATVMTPVQTAIRTSGGGTSQFISFTSLPAVGNYALVAIGARGSSSSAQVTGVTDNQGNVYTQITAPFNAVSGVAIYMTKVATSSGTFTVTVTWAAAVNGHGMYLLEMDQSVFSGTVDQTGTAGSTSNQSSFSVSGIAPNTNAGDFVLSIFCSGNAQSVAIGLSDPPSASYTSLGLVDSGVVSAALDAGYKTASGIETSSAGWTSTTAVAWSAAVATFLPASSPPPSNANGNTGRRRFGVRTIANL